jgi:hypothetical protein
MSMRTFLMGAALFLLGVHWPNSVELRPFDTYALSTDCGGASRLRWSGQRHEEGPEARWLASLRAADTADLYGRGRPYPASLPRLIINKAPYPECFGRTNQTGLILRRGGALPGRQDGTEMWNTIKHGETGRLPPCYRRRRAACVERQHGARSDFGLRRPGPLRGRTGAWRCRTSTRTS